MIKVPPRLIRTFRLVTLLIIVALGLIKIRRYLAMDDCLDQRHHWNHVQNVCEDD